MQFKDAMQINWYLIYCKPRQEQRAQQQLANQGFDTFLPLITLPANPLKKPAVAKAEPLFPRYLFLKADNLEFFSKIRSTRGVAGVVKFGQQLAYVAPDFIKQLMAQQIGLQQQLNQQLSLQAGDALHILSGPFASLNGVFSMADGTERSIVLINFLGQQLAVSVQNNQLQKVVPPPVIKR